MSQPRAEQLAVELATQDRDALIETLRSLECGFDIDFSNEFLDTIAIERLRHIVLAACLRAEREQQQG